VIGADAVSGCKLQVLSHSHSHTQHTQVKTFKSYVELYLRGQSSEEEEEEIPRKVIHEVVNPRWEVAVTASNSGFQQASFVNSIATTKVRSTFNATWLSSVLEV